MTIHLGRPSPAASCNQPGWRAKAPVRQWRSIPIRFCSRWGLPCRSCCVAEGAVRSYRTLSPLPAPDWSRGRRFAFCGTFPRVAPAGR